jgi:hypothetical protein
MEPASIKGHDAGDQAADLGVTSRGHHHFGSASRFYAWPTARRAVPRLNRSILSPVTVMR